MSEQIAGGETMPTAAAQPPAKRRRLDTRVLLPAAALALMLGVIFLLQPRAMSYNGLRLLLGLGLPLMFAAMAQLCVIAASDIDFGLGTFIGLVNCVAAKYLGAAPCWRRRSSSAWCSPMRAWGRSSNCAGCHRSW